MHYAVLNESISYTGKIHHPETTTTTFTHVNVGGWGLLEVTSRRLLTHVNVGGWGLGVVGGNFKCNNSVS